MTNIEHIPPKYDSWGYRTKETPNTLFRARLNVSESERAPIPDDWKKSSHLGNKPPYIELMAPKSRKEIREFTYPHFGTIEYTKAAQPFDHIVNPSLRQQSPVIVQSPSVAHTYRALSLDPIQPRPLTDEISQQSTSDWPFIRKDIEQNSKNPAHDRISTRRELLLHRKNIQTENLAKGYEIGIASKEKEKQSQEDPIRNTSSDSRLSMIARRQHDKLQALENWRQKHLAWTETQQSKEQTERDEYEQRMAAEAADSLKTVQNTTSPQLDRSTKRKNTITPKIGEATSHTSPNTRSPPSSSPQHDDPTFLSVKQRDFSSPQSKSPNTFPSEQMYITTGGGRKNLGMISAGALEHSVRPVSAMVRTQTQQEQATSSLPQVSHPPSASSSHQRPASATPAPTFTAMRWTTDRIVYNPPERVMDKIWNEALRQPFYPDAEDPPYFSSFALDKVFHEDRKVEKMMKRKERQAEKEKKERAELRKQAKQRRIEDDNRRTSVPLDALHISPVTTPRGAVDGLSHRSQLTSRPLSHRSVRVGYQLITPRPDLARPESVQSNHSIEMPDPNGVVLEPQRVKIRRDVRQQTRNHAIPSFTPSYQTTPRARPSSGQKLRIDRNSGSAMSQTRSDEIQKRRDSAPANTDRSLTDRTLSQTDQSPENLPISPDQTPLPSKRSHHSSQHEALDEVVTDRTLPPSQRESPRQYVSNIRNTSPTSERSEGAFASPFEKGFQWSDTALAILEEGRAHSNSTADEFEEI
ncbi:hypothetical protein BLNAU_5751 [Blattamonas nauphoetae]|uniref:Uncharacterized protein n=1 Tax=Blattamonas nauphoetae TaxID=2049346 RepID=A0ABQ9Y640_9EUKA|nr:hypothetical protein BLNAU_5751 [Blattamonas nauphoetae]